MGNWEEFKKADKVVAVAFLSSSTEAPAPEFSATANKHRDDYLFGLSTDAEVAAAAGVTPPAIAVFRSFDEPKTVYPYPISSAQVEDLESWIGDLAIPLLDEVGAENYQAYASSSKPLAYLFVDPTDEKHEEYVNSLRPVAAKYKGKVNFVWIDAVKYADHARALNLAEAKWPAFVVQDLEKQLKYPYDQHKEWTPEASEEQVALFLDNKLEPELKSQPIPEVQDEPVFNLVGKQFDEIVFDEERDIFVEFYATWFVLALPPFCNHRVDVIFQGVATASASSRLGTSWASTSPPSRTVSRSQRWRPRRTTFHPASPSASLVSLRSSSNPLVLVISSTTMVTGRSRASSPSLRRTQRTLLKSPRTPPSRSNRQSRSFWRTTMHITRSFNLAIAIATLNTLLLRFTHLLIVLVEPLLVRK